MSAGAPWSVKGIDPKAREIAKDLARREGMTLGEWLNRMILEDEAEGVSPMDSGPSASRGAVSPPTGRLEAPDHPADETSRVTRAIEALSRRIEAAESRSADTISSIEKSVREALFKMDNSGRDQVSIAARFDGTLLSLQSEQARIADRLRKVESEAAGPRSAEALQAIENAIINVAQRTEQTTSLLRNNLNAVEVRIDDLARTRPAADDLVGRISERLETAEARTTGALRDLGVSFAAMDVRLKSVETDAGAAVDGRLEALASELKAQMETARIDMADRLRQASEGRFDRMDKAIGEMSLHVRAAEQKSAVAIEQMGREVIGLAETMGRRMHQVEDRSTAAADKLGTEVARLAQAIDQKSSQGEQAQSQALEKLGLEIARITEKLSERIANADRRSATAIDDVGAQVARVTERLSERADRSSEELVQRIRQSEERTARLLDEARQKIDASLAASQVRATEQIVAANASRSGSGFGPKTLSEIDFDPVDQFDSDFLGPAEPVKAQAPQAVVPPPAPVAAPVRSPSIDASFDDLPDLPAFEPGPIAEAPRVQARIPEQSFDSLDDFETAFSKAPVASPQQVAPAAVLPRSAPSTEIDDLSDVFAALVDEPAVFNKSEPRATRDVVAEMRAAAKDRQSARPSEPDRSEKSSSSMFGGLSLGGRKKEKRRSGGSLSTALVVTGTAAVVGSGVAAYWIQNGKMQGDLPPRVANAVAQNTPAAVPTVPVETTADASPVFTDDHTTMQAAIAIDPKPLSKSAPATVATPAVTSKPERPVVNSSPAVVATALAAPQTATPSVMYKDAVRRIEAGDRTGVEALKKAANLGYPAAQFYLAKLYESGDAGVTKSVADARRWTERAATGGDRTAMHNLALYYFEGSGGPKSASSAAQWFRKAADLGLVDSQYNLGRLYEEGLGVSQNAAEAYKWYAIAARNGDTEGKSSAARLKARLSPEAQATAERAAGTFRSVAAPTPVQTANVGAGTSASATNAVVTAQRALARLGYYVGPTDGVNSPPLRLALSAWQKDQGLPTTGALDKTALDRLIPFTR
jgi:localization factor PodJL